MDYHIKVQEDASQYPAYLTETHAMRDLSRQLGSQLLYRDELLATSVQQRMITKGDTPFLELTLAAHIKAKPLGISIPPASDEVRTANMLFTISETLRKRREGKIDALSALFRIEETMQRNGYPLPASNIIGD